MLASVITSKKSCVGFLQSTSAPAVVQRSQPHARRQGRSDAGAGRAGKRRSVADVDADDVALQQVRGQ